MGLFDWLTGNKPAPAGVKRQSVAKLREALMAVNRKTAPFTVRSGQEGEGRLVAEWKIVDAKWYQIFAKAGIKRVFKVLMKFDEDKGEVRAVDQEWRSSGKPAYPPSRSRGKLSGGRKWRRASRASIAFREDGSWGRDLQLPIDTSEIKGPLIEAAHKAGWGWRGVAFSKL
jgi:hypothetical protein